MPVGRVIAIYARENGQGMAFPAPAPAAGGAGHRRGHSTVAASRTPLRDASRGTEGDASKVVHLVSGEARRTTRRHDDAGATPSDPDDPPRPPTDGGARPSLKRIK